MANYDRFHNKISKIFRRFNFILDATITLLDTLFQNAKENLSYTLTKLLKYVSLATLLVRLLMKSILLLIVLVMGLLTHQPSLHKVHTFI